MTPEEIERIGGPPTEDENRQYWEWMYRPQPDCVCGHPHREHNYPENLPMTVICHVGGCPCGDYRPKT